MTGGPFCHILSFKYVYNATALSMVLHYDLSTMLLSIVTQGCEVSSILTQ